MCMTTQLQALAVERRMADTFETVARKLAQNEATLGSLYELFGQSFPQDTELWVGLAADEYQHSLWIRKVSEAATPEQRQQSLPSIRVPAIETMIQYIGSIAGRCRRGELTRLNALALARDLEGSLLENKLLEALPGGTAGLATVQTSLIAQTAQHRQRLEDALERVRRQG